jgi:NADH-quinone oxidoreductase subunit N
MMTVGSVVALTQSNVRRLLTSSAIAQAGYVMAALAAGSARGATAAVIALVVYVVAQSGAFAVLALLRRHDLPGDALKDLRGLWTRQPFVAGAMLIFMLALGGVAPTAGFIGKLAVLGAAVHAGATSLAVVVVLNSALSLACYLRVVAFMSGDGAGLPRVTVSPALALAIGTTTLIVLGLGVFPQWLFVATDMSVHTLAAPRLSAFLQRW